jgi:4-amino-4-deoxy-L-arabinose transferase-like glycosyltransferase
MSLNLKDTSNKLGQRAFPYVLAALSLTILITSTLFAFRGEVNFDEGFNLQIPVNLIEHGSYSTSYNGSIPFDPEITTGPTVLLPIAGVFGLFGIGLYQARIVMLIYFLLMLLSAYFLSNKLFGRLGAVITLILIVSFRDLFYLGLKVLGEVPAVFFLLTGIIFYEKKKPLLSGILIGLAVLTKFFFLMSVAPFLTLFGIEFLFLPNKKKTFSFYSLLFLGMAIPNIAWECVKIFSLGFSGYKNNVIGFLDLVTNSTGSIQPFEMIARLQSLPAPLNGIPEIMILALLILLLIYSLIKYLFQLKTNGWSKTNQPILAIILFSLINLTWWIFNSSSSWWRYFLPGYIGMAVLAGQPLVSLIKPLAANFDTRREPFHGWSTFRYFLILVSSTVLFSLLIIEVISTQASLIYNQLRANPTYLTYQINLAKRISLIENNGGYIGYWGWWQAPDISFLSQSKFWNIDLPDTRDKFDSLAKQGHPLYILTTPVQRIQEPQSWYSEQLFCGKLAEDIGDYKLFEYVPEYDFGTQYQYLLDRGTIDLLTNGYSWDNKEPGNTYILTGIYPDSWIAKKASIWLKNKSEFNTLVINGEANLDFYEQKPLLIRIYGMGKLLKEEIFSQSGGFEWQIQLPASLHGYKALRITFQADQSFIPKALGINNDSRELSIKLYSIELNQFN